MLLLFSRIIHFCIILRSAEASGYIIQGSVVHSLTRGATRLQHGQRGQKRVKETRLRSKDCMAGDGLNANALSDKFEGLKAEECFRVKEVIMVWEKVALSASWLPRVQQKIWHTSLETLRLVRDAREKGEALAVSLAALIKRNLKINATQGGSIYFGWQIKKDFSPEWRRQGWWGVWRSCLYCDYSQEAHSDQEVDLGSTDLRTVPSDSLLPERPRLLQVPQASKPAQSVGPEKQGAKCSDSFMLREHFLVKPQRKM